MDSVTNMVTIKRIINERLLYAPVGFMIRLLSQKYKQNLSFLIHPTAQNAFNFYQSLSHQFDPDQLDSEHYQAFFQQGQCLHAIRNNTSEFYLFSGFEHRFFDLGQTNFSHSNILIYPSGIDCNNIEILAWRGVLTNVFSSVRSDSLGMLYEQINELLPQKLMSRLFGKNYLSEPMLAIISSTTRSTIAKQRKRLNKTKMQQSAQISAPTIFEQLIKGRQDGPC